MKKALAILLALVVLALPSSGRDDTNRIQRQLQEGSCTLVTGDGYEVPAWCLEDRPLIIVTDRRHGEDSGYYRGRWSITRDDWPGLGVEVTPVPGSWGQLCAFYREAPLPRGCRLRPLRLASSLPRQDESVFALDEAGATLLEGRVLRSSNRQARALFESDVDVAVGSAIVDDRCQVAGVCGKTRRDRKGGNWYTAVESMTGYRATLEQLKRQVREDVRRR